MNYFIVWNESRTEGFVTTSRQLAYEVRKAADSNCFNEDGTLNKVAVAFCEQHGMGNCTLDANVDYQSLTRDEIKALTSMQAGAPCEDRYIDWLAELFAIYEKLRAEGKRPFDPADLPQAEHEAYWRDGVAGVGVAVSKRGETFEYDAGDESKPQPKGVAAAVPMCSEQAVLHALTMARGETHQQGDAALWQAFGRAMWRQFNAMLPASQAPASAPRDETPWTAQPQIVRNLLESCANWLESRSHSLVLHIQPDPEEGGGYASLMREYAKNLRELNAVIQAPAVGAEGMVLVPATPTKAMVDAGRWSEYGEETSRLHDVDDEDVLAVWGRMLAAARPIQPPESEPDCWAILTPNGSRLVSPDEAKGRKDAYPLYTHPSNATAVEAPKVRAIAHKENGGWTVRIGSVAIGRWCYRGVVADREATGLANKVNAELDGKKVAAFGCESESFAPGKPSDCKWKGWCGGDNCPVSFEPAEVEAPAVGAELVVAWGWQWSSGAVVDLSYDTREAAEHAWEAHSGRDDGKVVAVCLVPQPPVQPMGDSNG